jgi:hypothetical protein
MPSTTLYKFPDLDKDIHLLVWEFTILDENVVEVKPEIFRPGDEGDSETHLRITSCTFFLYLPGSTTILLTQMANWVADRTFRTTCVNRETRGRTRSTLHTKNLMASHNLTFHVELVDCQTEDTVGLARASIEFLGTASDPSALSKEIVFPIRTTKLVFDASQICRNTLLEQVRKIEGIKKYIYHHQDRIRSLKSPNSVLC